MTRLALPMVTGSLDEAAIWSAGMATMTADEQVSWKAGMANAVAMEGRNPDVYVRLVDDLRTVAGKCGPIAAAFLEGFGV